MEDGVLHRVPQQRAPQEPVERGAQAAGACGGGRRGLEHTAGVTVLAPTAMDADAISTSTFVLGPTDGLAFLERLDRVEGMIVTKDQQQLRSRGFDRYAV